MILVPRGSIMWHGIAESRLLRSTGGAEVTWSSVENCRGANRGTS